MTINWKNYQFENLSNTILYEILKLRQEVFIVEQKCFYLDCDGLDHLAIHLCGFEKDSNKLIAYARIFPPGVLEEQNAAVIGRVIIALEARGKGLGYELMERAEKLCIAPEYYLGAQAHLEHFYKNAGYKRAGNNYDDAGIPHLPMKKKRVDE